MERKQREMVAAKRTKMMVGTYNKGAKQLPPLDVGDRVRIQNQTTTRPTKWDRTGVITATLGNRKYEIMMDGSRRLTTRNRRHLRRIPGGKTVPETEKHRGGEEEDEDDEDDDGYQSDPSPSPSLSTSPVPSGPPPIETTRAKLEEPEQERVPVPEPRSPSPAPSTRSSPAEATPAPRRSARERSAPDRLEVNTKGKSYAHAVVYGSCSVGPRGGGVVRRPGVRPERYERSEKRVTQELGSSPIVLNGAFL